MDAQSLRLLLIDDDWSNACLIQEFLARANGLYVELHHAERLSHGLMRLGSGLFDAVLLGLDLPDGAGLATVDQVHACVPNIPIVLLTGETAEQLALQAVKAGADDLICKQRLDPETLLRSIRYAVERAGRRTTDAKLQESELRYRTLFAESPDGVLLIDPETWLPVEFNDMACRHLGYTRDDFRHLRISDYEAGQTPAEIHARIAEVLGAGRATFETQHRTKAGALRDVLVVVQAITLAGRRYLHVIFHDVTEFRQAQDAWREAEQRFTALVSESTYGYAEVDSAGRILVTNRRLTEILGYTAEEARGRHFTEFVPEGHRAQASAAFEKALVRPPPNGPRTYELCAKDGTRKVVLVNSVPLHGRGKPVSLLAFFQDVTEQRRSEQSRQRSEAQLRGLFETMPDLVLVMDQTGRIEFANRPLPGMREEDALPTDGFAYILPEHRSRCQHGLTQALSTRQRQAFEAVDIYGNCWQCRLAPILSADPPDRAMLVCTDVTEQRKVEVALGERDKRYRDLLAAVTNYTYSVKLENGVPISTDHSWGCLSVTGYTPEDYRRDPYLWITMVHPDDRDTVRNYVTAILRGEHVGAIEHRVVRRDGAIRWLRDTIVPHHDGETLVRYDGLVEDVTDRWRAERALRDQEAQLLVAQKIQERLLPTAAPVVPGFDISGTLCPAEFTAGDFYDYLRLPEGRVGFVISDVLGHGFSSALLMATTSTLIRSLVEYHTDMGEILGKVNRFLVKETEDYFVTVLLGCLDPQDRTFVYASGGHPPGYVLSAAGDVKARLLSTAIPLAVYPETEFPLAEPVALESGDILLLATDGIHEAHSPEDKPLGIDRVLDAVRAHRTQTAAEIVARLRQLVFDFCQRDHLADDVTAVVVKVL